LPPSPPPPSNPVHPFPWLVALLIACAALASCCCLVAALALIYRRRVIRREPPKLQPEAKAGGHDKWIAWLPDPPAVSALSLLRALSQPLTRSRSPTPTLSLRAATCSSTASTGRR
jgi:hypothetical protein